MRIATYLPPGRTENSNEIIHIKHLAQSLALMVVAFEWSWK
jgi:hypothetical protein